MNKVFSKAKTFRESQTNSLSDFRKNKNSNFKDNTTRSKKLKKAKS